ncbi:hypothetical protein [Nonomuraea sp. NPDC049695]|uniref:hypothetical protein n=1 Tax=Nonomuraea sp. NPDC049695 TaxID=3154734 RepID=UPI003423F122
MTPSRTRILIMAGILGLVAVLGIAWLAGVATSGGTEPVADTGTNAPTGDADAPDGSTDTPDGSTGEDAPGRDTGDDTGDDNAEQPNGGGSTPQASRNTRRGVHWNGVRLDGSPGDDGCITIINKTSTVGTIESVSFTVESGPGRATARSAPGHCEPTGDPLCQGVTLRPGSQCLAGAIITGDASDKPYVIQAVVRFRYVCVNVEDAPCDEVRDWGGRPPTAEAPVVVTGTTANNVPRFEFYVGGSDTSDNGDGSSTSPEPEPDGTGTSTEDSGSSEEDSGTQDDGSGTSDDGATGADPATTPEG